VGAIPDGGSGTLPVYGAPLTISFAVAGRTAPLTAVAVDLTLTHSWAGDLDMVLTSPGGTASLVTVSRIGVTTANSVGDSSNYSGLYNFTDAATPATSRWAITGRRLEARLGKPIHHR
jgi:subtilisin-like proprotein convertase family protein